MLGWTVHQAPLTRRSADNVLVGHVRLSTRVRCSFDEADAVISLTKLMADVSIQVLQSFAIDSHVMVCNIPSPIY
ncbi:Hypothetical protein PHPALM_12544 [Phytophthora palmivora]|uniref:Uncharacterized protein n=1 Tax=Phytophthora palmivora TaxID=4796 RepID=A0A2P4XZH4_9STRA|nr:Hypothetical protein PHPALM_12544 [Phytophthora palmivora]